MGLFSATPKLTFFVSAGIFSWNQDVDYSDEAGPFSAGPSGTSATYSVGANFLFTRNFGWHLEWGRYESVGDLNESGHENDIDLVSTGIVYRFGL